MINWNVNKKDMPWIAMIAKRAYKKGLTKKTMQIEMDIVACHLNGNPLKLSDLFHADEFNFSHDIIGINKNINRNSGKLGNCFLPRYSK